MALERSCAQIIPTLPIYAIKRIIMINCNLIKFSQRKLVNILY